MHRLARLFQIAIERKHTEFQWFRLRHLGVSGSDPFKAKGQAGLPQDHQPDYVSDYEKNEHARKPDAGEPRKSFEQ